MKKVTLVALVALALSSCNSDPKFNVKGDVSGSRWKNALSGSFRT